MVASYDSGANTAFVRLSGSQANVVGTRCLVVLLDESDPNDAVVVSLY